MLFRVVGVEEEIFDPVEYADSDKGEGYERKDDDLHSRTCRLEPFAYPEERCRGDEEDDRNRADGSKRVRQTFVSQEFRHQHDEKPAQKQEIDGEFAIAILVSQSSDEKLDGSRDEIEEADQEGDTGNRVENRVRRIIMAPVLIADEIVFDETEAERFTERSPEIAVIDLGGENRDGVGATEEMMRILIKVPEHRRGDDEGGDYEDERMLPVYLEEVFV